jgi:hypothetical protein
MENKIELAKTLVWPVIALFVLIIFRSEIAEEIPNITRIKIGDVSIEKDSSLGRKAAPDTVESTRGLTQSSIFNLISRSTDIICFSPPVDTSITRKDHMQLIKYGLIEELPSDKYQSECFGYSEPPTLILLLTPKGKQVRGLLLGVLNDFTQST